MSEGAIENFKTVTLTLIIKPFPPANAIHVGLAILLSVCAFLNFTRVYPCDIQVYQAVKDAGSSYDALADLLELIERFLNRLAISTKIPPAVAMTEIHVKILVELLSILALATKQIKQGRASKSSDSSLT